MQAQTSAFQAFVHLIPQIPLLLSIIALRLTLEEKGRGPRFFDITIETSYLAYGSFLVPTFFSGTRNV